jgi:hypothetical protein
LKGRPRIWSPLEDVDLLRQRRDKVVEQITAEIKATGGNGFSRVYLFLEERGFFRKTEYWVLTIPEVGVRIEAPTEEQLIAKFRRFLLSRTVLEI